MDQNVMCLYVLDPPIWEVVEFWPGLWKFKSSDGTLAVITGEQIATGT